MKTVLVFGTSHTVPFARGHARARARGEVSYDIERVVFEGERYQPFIQVIPDVGLRFHPAAVEDLLAAVDRVRPACAVTAVLGAFHWAYGMSHEPRRFDFVVPDLPDLPVDETCELVPYDLLLRRFAGDLDWQFAFARAVIAHAQLPVFQLEAPPPIADTARMAAELSQVEKVRENMARYGLPSVSFRFKMWWLWTRVARRIGAELGLPFIAGPPETRDPQGFLDPRFFFDGVHGDDAYGALMSRQIEQAMQGLPTGAA